MNQTEVKRVAVLERRRDYLADLISNGKSTSHWDAGEQVALDWALTIVKKHFKEEDQ